MADTKELTIEEEAKKKLADTTKELHKREAELAFVRSKEGKALKAQIADAKVRLKIEEDKVDASDRVRQLDAQILNVENEIRAARESENDLIVKREKQLSKARAKAHKQQMANSREYGKELLSSLNPFKALGKALGDFVPKPIKIIGAAAAHYGGKFAGRSLRGTGRLGMKGARGIGSMFEGGPTPEEAPEVPEVIPETPVVGKRKTTKLDPKAFLLTSKTQPLHEEGKTPEVVPGEPAAGKKSGFFDRLFAEPEEEKIIGKASVLDATNELIRLAEERNKILERIFNRLPKPADASEEREEDIEKEDGDIDVDVIVAKDKKKGGWFSRLLSGGMAKMVAWAAAFGAMLLPLIAYAAVAAILAAGGMMLHSWMTKKWGPGADKNFAADTEREIEFDKYMKDKTGGKQGFVEATAAVAGAIQDLPEVEEGLAKEGIKLQNDMMEELGQETSAGTLTAIRRQGELQEETQLAANKIFDEGIGNVVEKIKSGELGPKGLGEHEGVLAAALAGISKGVDAAGEFVGIDNITGFMELSNAEQVELLEMLQIQLATNNEELKKTVAEAKTTDLKTLQKNNKDLAVRVAEAQGEKLAKEAFKHDTTNLEEDRIKIIDERFRELAQLSKGQAVASADEEKTRFALETMIKNNEMTSEELLLLMKNEDAYGLANFSKDQRDLIGQMALQKGVVTSQYGTTDVSAPVTTAVHPQESVSGITVEQIKEEQKAVEIAENLLATTVAKNKIKKLELEIAEKEKVVLEDGKELTKTSGNYELDRNLIREQIDKEAEELWEAQQKGLRMNEESFLASIDNIDDHTAHRDAYEAEVTRRQDLLYKKQVEGKKEEIKAIAAGVPVQPTTTAVTAAVVDTGAQAVKPTTTATGDAKPKTKEQIALDEYFDPGSIMKDRPLGPKEWTDAGQDADDHQDYLIEWEAATGKSYLTAGMTEETIAGGMETGRIMDESLKAVPTTTAAGTDAPDIKKRNLDLLEAEKKRYQKALEIEKVQDAEDKAFVEKWGKETGDVTFGEARYDDPEAMAAWKAKRDAQSAALDKEALGSSRDHIKNIESILGASYAQMSIDDFMKKKRAWRDFIADAALIRYAEETFGKEKLAAELPATSGSSATIRDESGERSYSLQAIGLGKEALRRDLLAPIPEKVTDTKYALANQGEGGLSMGGTYLPTSFTGYSNQKGITARTVKPAAPATTMMKAGENSLLAGVLADRKVAKALTDKVIAESVLPVEISKDPWRFGDYESYMGAGSIGDGPFSMETMHPGQALGHTIPKDLQVTAVIIKGGDQSGGAPVVINNVSNAPTSVSSSSPTTNLNIKAGINDPHTSKQPNHMHNARRY